VALHYDNGMCYFLFKLPLSYSAVVTEKALNWDYQKLNYCICLFETFRSSLYFLRQWTAGVTNRPTYLLSNSTDICHTVRIISSKMSFNINMLILYTCPCPRLEKCVVMGNINAPYYFHL
jgi:hypothetical protein